MDWQRVAAHVTGLQVMDLSDLLDMDLLRIPAELEIIALDSGALMAQARAGLDPHTRETVYELTFTTPTRTPWPAWHVVEFRIKEQCNKNIGTT